MKEPKQQYTIQLDPEFVAKIDEMAERMGIKRTQLMRNLMMAGYEDAVMLEDIGLFAAYKFGQKLIRKIKEGLASGKITYNEEGDLEIKKEIKK